MNQLVMCRGEYVDRGTLATIPTPPRTPTWIPVPHIEVVEKLTNSLLLKGFVITHEEFGLSADGKRMFGVVKISGSTTSE